MHVRTMVCDAHSEISESSLARSATTASLFDSSSHTARSSAWSTKSERRVSLGLIDAARVRLSKDLHSLIRRPSSKAQHRRTHSAQSASEKQASVRVDYAKDRSSKNLVKLHIGSMELLFEERQGRGIGTRIVNFLSRSRSRSRTKTKKRRSRSLDAALSHAPLPVQPSTIPTLARHPSLELKDSIQLAPTSTPTAKPSTRSRSRPLSTTTAGSNTTVRPSQKNREDVPPVVPPKDYPPIHEPEHALATSSRTGRKLFGIPLPSPRNGSFNNASKSKSRPTTPTAAASGSGTGDRKAWADFLPSSSRSGSQKSKAESTKYPTLHDDPHALQSLRDGRLFVDARSDRHNVITQPRPAPIHVLNSASQFRGEYPMHEGDLEATSIDLSGRCSPLCGLGSPKLPHAALDKGKERERAYDPRDQGRLSPRGERRIDRERERITHPRRVGSPIAREQERISRAGVVAAPLEKVSSGSATSRRSAMKDGVTNSSMSSAGVTARVKKIKHGSFDFERPVSNDVGAGMSVKAALKSMGVGDHSAPHGLHRSSSAKGTPRKERDGNVRADFRSQHVSSEPLQSRSRGKPVLDVNTHDLTRRTTGSSTASRPHPSAHHREAGNQNAHTLDYIPASPISSNSGNSSGMTSSWGRSAGKRMTRPSHPPFKFEPAVPPIPGSPAVDEQRGTPYRSTPTTRVHAEEIQPIPQPSKLRQARTAGKGRSLDLGLGLSWAPSRVREDAILHIGVSGPSSTATGATRIRTRWRGADVDEEGRLGLGTAADVAEAFREALGDAAYGTFKTYVHRFDAHAIPLDGPYGLLTHIRRLLDSAPGLDARSKQRLLDRFVRVVQENR